MLKKKRGSLVKAFAFGPILYASDSGGSIKTTIEITNLQVVNKIISGELRGLSPSLIIRKWECSICHQNLEDCEHEVGKKYDGLECQSIARDITPVEASLVTVPKDPRCRITDLLLIKEEDGKKILEWYGFSVDSEMDRFKNIQSAQNSKLISVDAAFHFSEFFSINLTGKSSYS